VASPLTIQRAGDTVWCTLDRPPLNLFEPTLIHAVRESFDALAADRSTRVAILLGAGRAFTAGMDVRVLRDLDVGRARVLISELHDAIAAVHRAPFPVIAAVNGACLGAGFELALACDLRVAAAGAVFGLPEVRVGVPSVIQAALLPPMIGPGRAAEMLLTGAPITAATALAWGLVNRVASAAELEATTLSLARELAGNAPLSQTGNKRVIAELLRAQGALDPVSKMPEFKICAVRVERRGPAQRFDALQIIKIRIDNDLAIVGSGRRRERRFVEIEANRRRSTAGGGHTAHFDFILPRSCRADRNSRSFRRDGGEIRDAGGVEVRTADGSDADRGLLHCGIALLGGHHDFGQRVRSGARHRSVLGRRWRADH